MTVPVAPCCAVVLNQQQQVIQHHEHYNRAQPDETGDVVTGKATIASDHTAPKQGTVVEHGRVVVKQLPHTDVEGYIDASQAAT